MIIDGTKLAGEILARAKARAAQFDRVPTLRVITSGGNAATASYLKIKQKRATDAGVEMIVQTASSTATTAELVSMVMCATEDAVIVQLPLGDEVDTKAVLEAIPVQKDADVLSSASRTLSGNTGLRNPYLLPPVAGAVADILKESGIEIEGKQAVVIGNGWLVGAPVAAWLAQQGATVTILTVENSNEEFTAALCAADIIVSGAGAPHLIKPGMIREGVALIDAGTTESGGILTGDADPACAPKCSIFTPVPGGVGPVTVAKLFENVITLAERANSKVA